jgi:hypothetical protein
VNDPERLVSILLLVLTGLLLAGRQLLSGRGRPWWVMAALDAPGVTALSGGLLAWAAPEWITASTKLLLQPAFLFLGGWVGLQIGCGLDLRAVRRAVVVPFLFEGATALATIATLFAMAYAAYRLIPGVPGPMPAALLVLAGACTAGPGLPQGGPALTRGAGRGGFWNPTLAAALAVLMAAVGSALAPGPTLQAGIFGWDGTIPVEIDSVLGRLLWVLIVGAVAGLVIDLATKDDFAPGGLYLQVAAVVLITAGVAGAIGLETLLVAAVAGFWLINATLRRLDILHVLQRGAGLPRLLVPLFGGVFVGVGVRSDGIDALSFGVILVLVLFMRPVARIVGRRMVLAGPLAERRRRQESLPSGLIEIDELGILLAAVLTRLLEPAAGVGAMAALLLAQWLLGLASRAWDQYEPSKGQES